MKQVRFSTLSMLHIYHGNEDLGHYTKADRGTFIRNAVMDANRIRRILRSTPSTPGSTLEELLKKCGISEEAIRGIEHLVLEQPNRIRERRQSLKKIVLAEQANQKMSGDDDHGKLARLSMILTKRPATRARKRATPAA